MSDAVRWWSAPVPNVDAIGLWIVRGGHEHLTETGWAHHGEWEPFPPAVMVTGLNAMAMRFARSADARRELADGLAADVEAVLAVALGAQRVDLLS